MGQMVNKPMWQAADGKLFESQVEMLEHEGAIMFDGVINQYLAETDATGGMGERAAKAAETRTRNILRSALGYFDSKGYVNPAAKQSVAQAA